MNPVGGKLLPDNLTTQANVVRYPLYSRHFTFIVGANQPKAIRDYEILGITQPTLLTPVGGELLPDTHALPVTTLPSM